VPRPGLQRVVSALQPPAYSIPRTTVCEKRRVNSVTTPTREQEHERDNSDFDDRDFDDRDDSDKDSEKTNPS
jgi:hypothetical protein